MMTTIREVRINAAPGIVVQGWRSTEDGLFLLARGQLEEVRLVCVCGRSHWIIREQFALGSASLILTCHTCGTRGSFVMEGVALPAP
jgi:hypothetical protein